MLFVQLDSIACTACLHPGDGGAPGAPVILAGRCVELDGSYAFAQMADWPEFERRVGGLIDCHVALATPFHRVGYLAALFGAAGSLVGIDRTDEFELSVALPLPLAALDFAPRNALTVDHLLPASMVRDIGLAAKLAGFCGTTVMPSVATLPVDQAWTQLIPQAQPNRFGCAIEIGAHELALIPFKLKDFNGISRTRPVGSPVLLPFAPSSQIGKSNNFYLDGLRHAIGASGENLLVSAELVRSVLQRACAVSVTEFLASGYRNRLRDGATPVECRPFEEWLIDALMSATAVDDLRPAQLMTNLTGDARNEIWVVAMNGIAARVAGADEAFKKQFCGAVPDDRGRKLGCLWTVYHPEATEGVTFAKTHDVGPIRSTAAWAGAVIINTGSRGIGRLSKIEIKATKDAKESVVDELDTKSRPHLTRCTAFWVEAPTSSGSDPKDSFAKVPFELSLHRDDGAPSLFSVEVELNHWERSQAVELEARVDHFDRVTVNIMVGGTPSPAIVSAKPESGSAVDSGELTQMRVQERDLGEFVLYVDEVHRELSRCIAGSERHKFRHRIFDPRPATA